MLLPLYHKENMELLGVFEINDTTLSKLVNWRVLRLPVKEPLETEVPSLADEPKTIKFWEFVFREFRMDDGSVFSVLITNDKEGALSIFGENVLVRSYLGVSTRLMGFGQLSL